MPFLRSLLILLGTVVLTACAVGPDYHRPDMHLPQQYLVRPAGESPSETAADLSTWWQSSDDPLLTRLVRTGLEQNLDLAQATARVTQARAGMTAATAALLPSASIAGSATRARQSIETPQGQLLNATPNYRRWGDLYEIDLQASWEIDVFGGERRGREAAVADYQASQAGVFATRLAVAAQIADTYIVIRGLQARLEIAKRQAATQEDLVDKVKLLFGHGVAAEYQLRQAEGELAQVRASIPALQTGLDAALNAVDVLLGDVPGTHRAEFAATAPIPTVPDIASMGTPAELLRRRPDLIVAERHLASANARIGEAISEYYPKFSLSALLGSATAVSSGDLFMSGANQTAGIFGLRWRLFDFGRINAEIAQAKGKEAETLAAYRLSVLHATEDTENAFSALVNRKEQSAALVMGEASLTRARQSSFLAYEKGAASLIDVLHADETLLQTSDARAQAQTEAARAAVAAYKALGGGWDLKASVDQSVGNANMIAAH